MFLSNNSSPLSQSQTFEWLFELTWNSSRALIHALTKCCKFKGFYLQHWETGRPILANSSYRAAFSRNIAIK